MNEQELYQLAEEILTASQFRRLHLHYWEGFKVSQIATMERVTETAIHKSIKRSILAIRKARDLREAA